MVLGRIALPIIALEAESISLCCNMNLAPIRNYALPFIISILNYYIVVLIAFFLTCEVQ